MYGITNRLFCSHCWYRFLTKSARTYQGIPRITILVLPSDEQAVWNLLVSFRISSLAMNGAQSHWFWHWFKVEAHLLIWI